ncbi:MAG: prepilin-type N-terminal cleavage/methylation domain-containing protein [Planctomycetota bacterium]
MRFRDAYQSFWRNPINHRSLGSRPTRGFTLLEMLLTLAMSVVLMTLIGGAIRFYAGEMASAESEFRQTQLAAAVLQMMEDDLRQALVVKPADTSALADVLSAATMPLESLGMTAPASEGGDVGLETLDAGTDGAAGIAGGDSSALPMDLSTSMGVLLEPGLVGDQTQLQIDVSRLPGLEAYAVDPDLAGPDPNGGLNDRPSDIKTIAYFVTSDGVGPTDVLQDLSDSSDQPSTVGGTGLVRRQIDRAISTEAASTGGLTRLLSSGQIVAPEVIGVEFEYFDGVTWVPMFNSDEYGFLPVAVRVTLMMQSATSGTDAAMTTKTFTHLIYLPFSSPEDAEEELMATTGDIL